MTKEDYLSLPINQQQAILHTYHGEEGSPFESFLKNHRFVIPCDGSSKVEVVNLDNRKFEPPELILPEKFTPEVETVSGQNRYGGKVETIDYIEYVGECWNKNGLSQQQIFCLQQVLKYVSSRLGKKDDIKIELGKAKNYLNRAITGKWEVQ